jgi:SSS family solute:Na+ symporter
MIGGVALLPFAFFLAGKVRALEVLTLPDILRRAYGPRVSVAAATVIGVAWCGVVAAQIVAGGLLLSGVLSLSFQGALALITVVFVVYTLWGGQTSVVRTDAWQILLFVGALAACIVLVLSAGPPEGGWAANVPAGHWSFPVSPGFGWVDLLVVYPLVVGMPYLVGPDIYSRVFCARDEASARKASFLAAALVIPLSLVLAILGLLLRASFPELAPESALPTALTRLAPAGFRALIVVGLLGAIMSSADTTLISASTILTLNVVAPLLSMDERAKLRLTRGLVLLVGVVAWGIAAFQEGIISSLLLAYTVFVGGVALPTLASFWKDRLGLSSVGALSAVVVGGGSALLLELLGGPGGGGVGRIIPLALSGTTLLLVGRRKEFDRSRNPEG